jgi:hypothetical protein
MEPTVYSYYYQAGKQEAEQGDTVFLFFLASYESNLASKSVIASTTAE